MLVVHRTRRLCAVTFVLLAAGSLSGCEGNTQPETGRLDVVLSQSSSGLSASLIATAETAEVKAAQAGVPLESIESIMVTVTSIAVHRVGPDEDATSDDSATGSEDEASEDDGSEGVEGEEEDGGSWISIDLPEGGVTVNLIGLSPQEIGSADVPGGSYNQVRLFFNASTIVFAEDVSVGGGDPYVAGTSYELQIPSGASSGIKVQTGMFDVPEGGTETVGLVIDLANSVKNVTANQNRVSMTPVIVGVVGSADS